MATHRHHRERHAGDGQVTENERRLHRSAELAKLMIDRSLAAIVAGESGLADDFAADLAHHLKLATETARHLYVERDLARIARGVSGQWESD
jgi:hypothetical protein